MEAFYRAVKKHRFSFLFMPGVVSIGQGIKMTGNMYAGTNSLVIGVKKKLPLQEIPRDRRIPRFIDHLPTDVVEVGNINFIGYALPDTVFFPADNLEFRQKRNRPAQPGMSIGHYKISAGTFGALVEGDFPGKVAILSNNHILANGTSGRDGLARKGDAILQPGPYDKGRAEDMIGRLHAYSPMLPEKRGDRGPVNKIDAALAVPVKPDMVKANILEIGLVKETAKAVPGQVVFKSGRSSGVTRGVVRSVGNTIRVENNGKNYIYEDQIGFTAATEGGDSGSLLVNQQGKAVGLLFAGSRNYTFANPIDSVLKYFGVKLYG